MNAIKPEDIAISLVREEYPRELMKYFRSCDYEVDEKYPGIHYVTGGIFPIQVIVSGKLDQELHLWLTSLTRNMEKDQAKSLVYRILCGKRR